ncbi:MAG TPA: hypothetical protein VGB53_01615 [Rubricoccaceae bacterium]|jgi:hypothetical protein
MNLNPAPLPSETFAALDAAIWPMSTPADRARLLALAVEILLGCTDAERDGGAVALAFWLVLARTYGLGADVADAPLWLALRLGLDHAAAVACVEFGQQVGAFRVVPGLDGAGPVVRLVCPSFAFLTLLTPAEETSAETP